MSATFFFLSVSLLRLAFAIFMHNVVLGNGIHCMINIRQVKLSMQVIQALESGKRKVIEHITCEIM